MMNRGFLWMKLNVFLATLLFIFGCSGKEIVTVPDKPGSEQFIASGDPYLIGPEDVLQITVWNEPALTRTVTVRMDGKISLPLIDEVHAAGMKPIELKDLLTEKLKNFINNPMVFVTVVEANSFKVYISGEVRTPGVYKLKGRTSMIQLISIAGGFTEWAKTKRILLIRSEKGIEKRINVNYQELLKADRLDESMYLKAGDIVVVP